MDKLIKEVLDEKKNDLIIKENDTLYQITTSFYQNNNDYKNISSINLGEFENIIKENYNIPKNEPLIIFKIEQNIEGLLIPFIDFEIFNPETKEKLNLSDFNNERVYIEIYIPVSINESELYKYELNSSYYNDICNTLSINGYDITLYDRKNEYIKNNMSLCQSNFKYIRYDYLNKKAICQFNIQERIPLFEQSNEKLFLYDIENDKNFTNFNVMKCPKLLFSKKGLIKNIGNYFFSLIIILYIILAILFYIKGFDYLCKQINEILHFKNEQNNLKKILKKEKQNKENNLDIISSSKKNREGNNISKNNSDIQTNMDMSISRDIINKFNEKNSQKTENEMKIYYIDYEINHFSYDDAIKKDKRTFLEFYFSYLKLNLLLLFIFNKKKDYNSNIIKFSLLLFFLAIFLVVNALFFNDSMMHKIYEKKNKFNFFCIIPELVYSTIICDIIMSIVKRVFLSRKNLLELKKEKNQYNLKGKTMIVLKCLIIKYIIFFSLSILLFIFFWYYLSCFCSVYSNTQIYLIKNTLIIIFISIIYRFIIYLIPCIFRFFALKGTSGKILYKTSQYIKLF